jgi:DivIVA domain-containing protein
VPLTPADVANKQFKIGFRGYSLDEVDAFLDEVESELSRLLTENQELRVGRAAVPAAAAVPVPPAPVPAPPAPVVAAPVAPAATVAPEEGQEAALRTLLLAQRTADAAVSEARAEAAQIVADAQARADRVDAEVAARVDAAMVPLESHKRGLEAQIEDLRAFEREYRTRLKAYLENQLQDLSGRGAPDDAGAGVPAGARAAAIGMPRPPAGPAALSPAPDGGPQSVGVQAAPSVAPPAGPPREAGEAAGGTASLHAVPPLQPPAGPFTTLPPSAFADLVDDRPEPPAAR